MIRIERNTNINCTQRSKPSRRQAEIFCLSRVHYPSPNSSPDLSSYAGMQWSDPSPRLPKCGLVDSGTRPRLKLSTLQLLQIMYLHEARDVDVSRCDADGWCMSTSFLVSLIRVQELSCLRSCEQVCSWLLLILELAAAISNAGGLGMVTALTQPTPEALRYVFHGV